MPESAHAKWFAGSPRLALPVFLGLVLLVRLVHLALLGTPLTGMNPKMAVLAKDWLQFGFGAALVDVPPGPVCLLAALSGLVGAQPAGLIPLVLLIAHLCLAAGFWCWLKALRPDNDLAATSLMLFVFLPAHNSYVGLDNFPVLFAAAAFLGAVSIWHQSLDGPLRRKSVLWLLVLSTAIGMFRGEYLFFLPLYFVVFCGLHRVWQERCPPRIAWATALVMIVALGIGTSTMLFFRPFNSRSFALVPPDYTCWTFLDGTPSAWQTPADRSEADRVRRGIEHFGHPAEYGYSVRRMVLSNPGQTVSKFVLNLPAWLYELGRRHVVVPLPLAVFAAWGAVVLLRRRGRQVTDTCWPATLAMILMTVFLAALIISARYMMPAFGAVCVLAAAGLLAAFAWLRRVLPPGAEQHIVWWFGIVSVCAGLELCLLRGGGLLRDAPDVRPVARYLDERFGGLQRVPLVIDPNSDAIDGGCRANICNRWIYRAQGWTRFGVDPKDPLAAALSPEAAACDLHTAVLWVAGDGNAPADRQRLAQWTEAGFRLQQVATTPEDALPRYTLFVLRGQQPE